MSTTTDPVDWGLAVRIAGKVAGTNEYARSYHRDSLTSDFDEFTSHAEELVAKETGLRSVSGPARARVLTRTEWVSANVASFRRMLAPLLDRMGPQLTGPLAVPARAFAGAEVGTLLGWMSQRVLGQYDVMVSNDNPDDGDVVYYVGSNVLAIEKRFGFPPREFRLWLALHEVTHRAQFTGVPWMRKYYLDLVQSTLGQLDADPKRFLEALQRAVREVRAGQNPIADAGLVGLIAGNEQRAAMDKIAGLMSLLEGHGDTTMNRAGADAVPSADRFARTLTNRRAESRGVSKLVRVALGIEAKMRQYAEGEAFIEHVEAQCGPKFLDRVWGSVAALPNLAEIRSPDAWIERVTPLPALARAG